MERSRERQLGARRRQQTPCMAAAWAIGHVCGVDRELVISSLLVRPCSRLQSSYSEVRSARALHRAVDGRARECVAVYTLSTKVERASRYKIVLAYILVAARIALQ